MRLAEILSAAQSPPNEPSGELSTALATRTPQPQAPSIRDILTRFLGFGGQNQQPVETAMRGQTPEEQIKFGGDSGEMRPANVAQQAMLSLPHPISDAMDNIGKASALAQNLGATPDQVGFQPALTAFHGSPYDFERFAMEHVGNGEGAQVFGHGLYFAENPAVAQEYRGRLSAMPSREQLAEYFKPGSIVPSYGGSDRVIEFRPGAGTDFSVVVQGVTKRGDQWVATGRPRVHGTMPSPADFQKVTGQHLGKLYTVDIPDESVGKMLDWDKPISQQSPEVQNAIAPVIESAAKTFPNIKSGEATGKGIYLAYAQHRGGNPEAASGAFRAAGIPGIKYLDQGSRRAGQGTRNFVVFDDSLLKILKKD